MSERPSVAASVIKALHRTRARGPSETLSLLGHRVADAIGSEDELIVWSRPTGSAPPPALGGKTGGEAATTDWRLRKAGPEDAEAYARDIGTDSAKTFRSRLGPVTWCFVVEDGDRLVHSSWVTTHRAWTRELRAYVSPPEDDAYVYESFTRPEVRGRGVYPFALSGIAADISGASRCLWVMVEADNPASTKAVMKAGFEREGSFQVRRRYGRLLLEVQGDPGLIASRAGGAAKQSDP